MDEIISISALNQYVFCPRRCALMHIEGVWRDNEHTTQGSLMHQNADERGYETVREARCLRALPLYSTIYGLSGRADIVEIRSNEVIPIEYKKGKRREFDNDNIQLTAQALCLEEMFQTKVKRGFIYHAASHKRREVLFDDELRLAVLETIARIRELLQSEKVPPADYQPRCQGCSLFNTCLPKLTDVGEREILLRDLI